MNNDITREELLRSNEYWMVQLQNDLYGVIEDYRKNNDLNRSELAKQFGVTKGYITQIFNGEYDHKISKLVSLSLASGKVPILNFIDLDKFIKDDANDMIYRLYRISRQGEFDSLQQSNSKQQEHRLTNDFVRLDKVA